MTLLVFSASAHLLSQSTVGSMAGDCIIGALSMVWLARSVLQDVGQAVTLQVDIQPSLDGVLDVGCMYM